MTTITRTAPATQTVRAAVAGLLAIGLAAGAMPAHAAKGDNEKCAGVVKAGKNDCATASSACAGTVSKDNQKDAWIYVPKGTCEKIAGGVVVADAKK